METAWELELAEFLTDLSAVQDESLALLTRKRQLLSAVDLEGLAAITPQEEQLLGKLEGCLKRRAALLERAAAAGLPADNLTALSAALPNGARGKIANQITHASAKARLLQHHSLVNWVLVQRSLIHLSQLLEIIATGGQLKPTYGKGESAESRGKLIDQAV